MPKSYKDHMEKTFGPSWFNKTPQELLFEMSTWVDSNGDSNGISVSVSRDTLFALAVYVADTCEWKGAALYAL